MHRFYSEHTDFKQTPVAILDRDEIHHIKDVLRLKKGAIVQIFNGRSQEADVEIDQVSDDKITGKVIALREAQVSACKIILACAPPKKGKFEFIIEKCTELGVDEIIPLKTKRSEVVFDEDRMASKLNRFEAVAVNAAKQSKQMRVPLVRPMQTLNEVFRTLGKNGVLLFPSLNGKAVHIREALKVKDPSQVVVFIGPEGDFTPDEVELALKNGCVPVSLGSTVLKVETAAIAAVSLVRFLYRD